MMNNELQSKVERIVNNEVLTCQSSLVEMLLQNDLASYDDIINMYVDNSEKIEELQNKIDEIEENEELTEDQENEISELEERIEELAQEEEEPQEIFEWWVVSDWLADKLEEAGEPILKSDYETWWGRTTTGQSISMDYVIQNIVKNI